VRGIDRVKDTLAIHNGLFRTPEWNCDELETACSVVLKLR